MSRYIDADKLCEGRVSNDPVVIAVNCEPTADVKPVMHGKWLHLRQHGMSYDVECEKCRHLFRIPQGYRYNFCPSCGADMRSNNAERISETE